MTWKTLKYWLNFNFNSGDENWLKVGQTLSGTLTKVYNIQQSFSWS